MKRNIYLVARREFLEYVRTKMFWLSVLIVPFIIVLALVLPVLLERKKPVRTYAIVDYSGKFAERFLAEAFADDVERALKTLIQQHEKGEPLPKGVAEDVRILASVVHKSSEELDTLSGTWHKIFVREIASLLGQVKNDRGISGAEDRSTAVRGHLIRFARWWWSLSSQKKHELFPRSKTLRFQYVRMASHDEETLNTLVRDNKLYAYFVIPRDPITTSRFSYIARSLSDDTLKAWFESVMGRIIRQEKLKQLSIDDKTLQDVMKGISFETYVLSKQGKAKQATLEDKIRPWMAFAFVYILFLAIIMGAQMLMTNTIEEKSDRVLEILLSSVNTNELLAGKVLGIATTGFTVLGIWALFFIGAQMVAWIYIPMIRELQLHRFLLDPYFIIYFIVFFVTGYLFYASILVGLGSVCNTLKEAQSLSQPVFIAIVIPLLASQTIIREPNGILARVLSYIPPFTPFVMMTRAGGNPPWLEFILATVVMVVSTIVTVRLASRVFEVGIFMTGKTPTLKTIWTILRETRNA